VRFLFARHGESLANVSRTFSNRDPWHPLTDAGRLQAMALADLLEHEKIASIACSPAVRARETAEIVARSLGTEIRVVEALREFDVGAWEGTAAQEGWDEWLDVVRAWSKGHSDARVAGGESLEDILSRFGAWLTAEADQQPAGHTTLVIAHGGIYQAALPHLLTGLPAGIASEYPIGHCDVVVAEKRGAGWQCLRWGSWVPG